MAALVQPFPRSGLTAPKPPPVLPAQGGVLAPSTGLDATSNPGSGDADTGSLDPFAGPPAPATPQGLGQGVIGTGGGGGSAPDPMAIPTAVLTPYDAGARWSRGKLVGRGPLVDGRLVPIVSLKGNLPPTPGRLPWYILADINRNAWFILGDGYDWQGDGTDAQSAAVHDAWAASTAAIMLANGWRDGNGTDQGLGAQWPVYGGGLALNWNPARAFDYDKQKIAIPAHPEMVLSGPDYQTGVVQNGSGQLGLIYPHDGVYGRGVEPRIAPVTNTLFLLQASDGTKIGMLATVNRWTRTGYFSQVLGAAPTSDDYTSWNTVLSYAGTGASIGTAILPGLGTLIGAALGALATVIIAAIQVSQELAKRKDEINSAEGLAFNNAPQVLSGSAPFSSMAQEFGLTDEGGSLPPGSRPPGSGPGGGVVPSAGGNSLLWLALAGIGGYLLLKE
jgi:hypothetical protein